MSQKRFEGKVAVVTGGNSGIGLAAAKAYAREGAKVVITGRNAETLKKAAAEIGPGTLVIQSDMGKVSDIEKAVAQIQKTFGRIDAMFLNAGGGNFTALEQVTEAFYEETFNVNVKGIIFMMQKALPLMPKGSAVALNASINGHMAMPNATVYGATKAAVINLAKTLSVELLDRGIRVNSISPGPIETAILSRNMSPEQLKQMKEWIVSQVPLKRFGQPEDIAAAVLYLTSAESSYVIGTDLIVDGGMKTLH
jgi:NAD(P)-dependent dehydrogenase (short-subunit alcohol dehydrogenase family)